MTFKKNITKLALSLIVSITILCINPASAADITYTFDHAACATEDSGECICDDYDAATDTCTISGIHQYVWNYYSPVSLTLNFDNIVVSGKINSPAIDMTAANSVHVTSTGIIDTSPPYGFSSPMTASLTITAPNVNILGTIRSISAYMIKRTVTIQSVNIDISGTIDVLSSSYYFGCSLPTLIIESDTLNISGTVGGAYSNYAIKIIINANDLQVSGSVQNTGYNRWGTIDMDGLISINSGTISLAGGIIKTGTMYPTPIHITYCAITPADCEDATGCPQIVADPGNLFLNNNCQVTATCQSGDGCIANDPQSGSPCAIPDPDCPAGTTGIPVPTFLSLQGTVTDLDDNPVTGTIEITKISMCSTDACSTPTPVTIPHQAHTFENGIVNLLIGSYELIPNQRYIMELNLTSASKTDTINMKFSA